MKSGPDRLHYESGTLLGDKYRLRRLLEGGPSSSVWLANHEALEMPVAIKIVRPEGDGPRGVLPEGRIVARLRHPAIISVFDFGYTPVGDPFLVMEYLAGSPLSEVLAREGRLPVRTAVQLLLPVLDALCLCHAQGIVHRDVKPANIFFARERGETRVKLIDFGVAKPVCSGVVFPEVAGTPGYMAPEQVHGGPDADHRADVWAFCAVLYEAIAGRPVIEAPTWQQALVANADPKIVPLKEGEAAGLWPILEAGLSKDPADRPWSIDVRGSLVWWLSREGGLDVPELRQAPREAPAIPSRPPAAAHRPLH